VFVHGGGFVAGDKAYPGAPAYDLVGAWAVRHGWVGVNITYRYAPEVKWPAGAEDVAAAVAWIRENIAAYGGDPGRIVVMGNSAGAVHASLPCLVRSPVPLLFAVAERDPDRFHAAVVEAAVAWRARHGTVPNLVWIDGHNHMSAVGSLGVDEAALGVPLARFVERYTAAD
jgi:hypothetical protein